jgi:hypothetical protein
MSIFVGFLDLMRTAVLDTTVSIGFSPAAFIVSPDSINLSERTSMGKDVLANKIHNSVCNTKSTCSLDTATQFNDLRLQLL